ESIGKSNEGSHKLDLVAKSIQQMTSSASQVKTLIDEVDVGSREQARGIEQISLAVAQMEKLTQRNAANAEQSAAAGEELAAQARSLHDSVERLRNIAGNFRERSIPSEERIAAADPGVPHVPALAVSAPAVSRARDAFPLD